MTHRWLLVLIRLQPSCTYCAVRGSALSVDLLPAVYSMGDGCHPYNYGLCLGGSVYSVCQSDRSVCLASRASGCAWVPEEKFSKSAPNRRTPKRSFQACPYLICCAMPIQMEDVCKCVQAGVRSTVRWSRKWPHAWTALCLGYCMEQSSCVEFASRVLIGVAVSQ